ncbi:hypothetical protein K503DRAFT_720759 [Rhizopogon vinicolor AM-OR11-026]|uniref:DUF6533 domain-containing protein n=1 Tax=Rhizopogon vinicolor AM-OR11-026 TaxID=1314800 RepID=A0A1B7MW27_9AGAM|nr:hypothetical protein K503DRAFT_720759 [Rhizopogon vinicolor AM-OR11-026]
METLYSAETIAAARSVQIVTYIYTSMATFWMYDYVCSVRKEWTFLLQSRWTKVKGLFIITRYTPFLLLIVHLYLSLIPNENSNKCQLLNNISSSFSLISVISSECFFILRTYALWNNNKVVLAFIVTTFCACFTASIVVSFSVSASAPFNTSMIPGITGCYQATGSTTLFVPFLLLSVVEMSLVTLTIVRAIQNWRTTRNPLYTVLLRHNVFYYVCGLFFSVLNVITSLLLQYAYSGMFQDLQFIVLAILATRMHLHLWHIDQHLRGRGTDITIHIPMSDISPRPMVL